MGHKARLVTITGILILTFMVSVTQGWAKPLRNRQRMMEKIETIKMWKLMDALDLDSQTALKVFPIIRKIDKKRLDLRAKQRDLLDKIENLVKEGKGNANSLDTLANQLFDLNEQISQLPREEYRRLKPVLAETQLARYLIFQKRFRKELIHRWMQNRRRKPVQERSGPGVRSRNGLIVQPPQPQP